jgi:undecaprenyl diphosphate synthase
MSQIEGLNHVAIIPDGNRRWAALKQLPKIEGHRAGANRMHDLVAELIKLQVKYLTLWGFSTDNWKRDTDEVNSIFDLLELWIRHDAPWLHANGVRLKHIGRFHELPDTLQRTIAAAIYLTRRNTGMTLNLAFNYSGRAELVDAVRRLLNDQVPWNLVDEQLFSRYLYTDGVPDVDLVIRTADELRVSNFMLWQAAYAEYYFTPVFWPDFDAIELEKALQAYSERKRRFGGD